MSNTQETLIKWVVAAGSLVASGVIVSAAVGVLLTPPQAEAVAAVPAPEAVEVAVAEVAQPVIPEPVAVVAQPEPVAAAPVIETAPVVTAAEVEEAKATTYAVSAHRIFIRNKASMDHSTRVSVWREGHQFKGNNIKKVGTKEWVEIVEDCFAQCETLEEPLWISKKFVQEI